MLIIQSHMVHLPMHVRKDVPVYECDKVRNLIKEMSNKLIFITACIK